MMKTMIPPKSGRDFGLYKNKRGQRSPPKRKEKEKKKKERRKKIKKERRKEKKYNERKREKGQCYYLFFHTCASR